MNDVINLCGDWKLYYYPQTSNNIRHPRDLAKQGLKAITAIVPGNVELDLGRAGELPEDLFYANNIYLVKKYEGYEWWYEKRFTAPMLNAGQKMKLVFYGVDCIAKYWLNGQTIGRTENMFLRHEFDITNIVKPKEENVIHVRLSSPVEAALNKTYNPLMLATQTCMDSLWIRKAAHSYGWDIMPRVLSAGLWRPVEIVIYQEPCIEELYFYTVSVSEKKARLGIYYRIAAQLEDFYGSSIEIAGKCGDSTFTSSAKLKFVRGTIFADIEKPRLWWPAGYGAPDLYQITAALLKKGEVADRRINMIGVRTVELLRTELTSSENPGEFLFKINGVPVMAKGSNHVPLDVFHSRDSERYEKVVGMYGDLKCNIIRCWGGNVYEDHKFYELCDQKGIMVWQDFGMACGFYPQYKEFYDVIEKEVVEVVKKLRNHCCIILWCGDNECDQFLYRRGYKPSNNRITRDILPKAIMNHDPNRPYLESSPYISDTVL
jgi:beta-mannosidase